MTVQVPLAGSSLLDNVATESRSQKKRVCDALCLVVADLPSANGITQTVNTAAKQARNSGIRSLAVVLN